MKEFFKELFEYSNHYNQQLALILTENQDKVSEKSVKLYNHILNAQQIWNDRIQSRKVAIGVWDMRPVLNLKTIDQDNFEKSLEIIENFDLNDTIAYTKFNGQKFSNSVRDMLFQIINHSTYHRGQIASEFRSSGIEPIISDFIFYKR